MKDYPSAIWQLNRGLWAANYFRPLLSEVLD